MSLYLDVYHHNQRHYEFLNIHINRKKPSEEDKEKRKLANEIRAKREHELIVQENGLIDKKRKQADFAKFFEDFINSKNHNYQLTATLYQLREFTKHRPLPITRITPEWMKDFENHLLKEVSNNSALGYLKNTNSALNELVRKQVTARNP